MERAKREYFEKETLEVAKNILGDFIIRKTKNNLIRAKIIEVEAYIGPEDQASHTRNNKKTKRNKVVWKRGGHLYVYLTYGIHWMLNIVTEKKSVPECVLIRAVETVKGLELIKENRKIKSKKIEELTNGPGKLSQALKIDKSFDGCDLVKSNNLYLIENEIKNLNIKSVPRVNIDYAEEYKNKKWRFCIKNNKFIS